MADFDERSGIVACKTSWGLWFQTLDEVSMEISVDNSLKPKEVSVVCQQKHLTVKIRNSSLIEVCCCINIEAYMVMRLGCNTWVFMVINNQEIYMYTYIFISFHVITTLLWLLFLLNQRKSLISVDYPINQIHCMA